MINPYISVHSSQLREEYLTIKFTCLYLPLLNLTFLYLFIHF